MTGQFLTCQQAGELLNCSPKTIREMVLTGRIPPAYVVQISPSDRRINRAAFEPKPPTPIHQPITEERFRQIVREEINRVFRIEQREFRIERDA